MEKKTKLQFKKRNKTKQHKTHKKKKTTNQTNIGRSCINHFPITAQWKQTNKQTNKQIG
jgi:hypothetical protein